MKLDLNNEADYWSESHGSENHKKNDDINEDQQDSDAFDIDIHGKTLAYCKGNRILF